mmetsp:Transcript_30579/g.90751  ORF Transcript_30579/g.90751 Transcript_30579/m.90751 type:complete len:563 (-) Transcript_30579:83-1771(-)
MEGQLARLTEQVLLQAILEERAKGLEAPCEAAAPPVSDGRTSKQQRRRERRRQRQAAAHRPATVAAPGADGGVEAEAASEAEDTAEGPASRRGSDGQVEEAEVALHCEPGCDSDGPAADGRSVGDGHEPDIPDGLPAAIAPAGTEEETAAPGDHGDQQCIEPEIAADVLDVLRARADGPTADGQLADGGQEPDVPDGLPAAFVRAATEEEELAAPGDQRRIEPEIAADVMDVLRNQVERLAHELRSKPGAGARSAAAATLGTVGASAFPTVLGIALGADGTVTSSLKGAEAEQDGLHDRRAESGCGGEIRGIGQGKPILLLPGACSRDEGYARGMGRGRALAPPPGLPPRAGVRSPLAPQGLADIWSTGWTIPEEESRLTQPDEGLQLEEEEEGGGWEEDLFGLLPGAAELPPGPLWPQWPPPVDEEAPLATSSVGSPLFGPSQQGRPLPERSRAASFAPSPSVTWSKTPSPPGTPLPPWRLSGCAPALGSAAGAGGGGRAAWPTGAAPIPAYITVPVAMAQLCPRCGQALAVLPPDGDPGPPPGGGILEGLGPLAPLVEVH